MTDPIRLPNKPIGSVPAFTIGLQDEGGGNYSVKKFPSLTANPGLVYTTRAALYADLAKAANTQAWVLGDSTAAYNGVYQKSGASGSGSWSRVGDIPASVIFATDAGTGTANAIVATSALPISGSALVAMQIYRTNTGSPVTAVFNSGSALTIKTNTGNDISAGGLLAGMWVLGTVSGATFRLVSDQASAAIQAAAEAAQVIAEAARDAALGAVPNVFTADRTAMKALDTGTITDAFLREAGREGQFLWDGSDLSAQLLGDSIASSAVDSSTDVITSVSHNLVTGQAVVATSAVDGLSTNTLYYAINLTTSAIGYRAETAAFTAGQTLTGGASGATATISKVIDNGTTGVLWLTGVTGTFQASETITDGAGGSATAAAAVYTTTNLDKFKLATSVTNAYAGTAVDLTGTSAVTLKPHLDPTEALYVCKAADITGASGSWKRVYSGGIKSTWAGMSPSATEAANVAALAGLLGRSRSFDIVIEMVCGYYGFNQKLRARTSNTLAIKGEILDASYLRWSNADGGIEIQYTEASHPPSVIAVNFETSQAGGGTALKMETSYRPFPVDYGPQIIDVDCRGINPSTQYWSRGAVIEHAWYPVVERFDFKGIESNTGQYLTTYPAVHGLSLVDCQAPQIRDPVIYHVQKGIYCGGNVAGDGNAHGEGLSVTGGEIVGVGYGIDCDLVGTFKAGTAIANLHINAFYRAIRLLNVGEMSLNNLLLYKTVISTHDWQAVEMIGCYGNIINHLMLACPDVSSGYASGVTLTNSDQNAISNVLCENWYGIGAVVLLAGSSSYNDFSNLKVGRNPASLVIVDKVAYTGTVNKFANCTPCSEQTLTANSTGPSVDLDVGGAWKTANSAPTSITNFAGGYSGQIVQVLVNDGNTTFVHGSTMYLKSGTNTSPSSGSIITLQKRGSLWREISRSY